MYEVRTVFYSGEQAQYYILNLSTRRVQSVWNSYKDAWFTARFLNRVSA